MQLITPAVLFFTLSDDSKHVSVGMADCHAYVSPVDGQICPMLSTAKNAKLKQKAFKHHENTGFLQSVRQGLQLALETMQNNAAIVDMPNMSTFAFIKEYVWAE